jgi:GNAT superfamily N-acetyltransferase
MRTTSADPHRIAIRTALSAGDADAIVALHDRVYATEYGLDRRFAASISLSLEAAVASGWPDTSGAVWLIDRGSQLGGSLALTDEGGGLGRVRWFVLAPELRGHGLGRRLVQRLLSEARGARLATLELETFSALTVAARIYRAAGFELRWERETDRWGPGIQMQGYALSLN